MESKGEFKKLDGNHEIKKDRVLSEFIKSNAVFSLPSNFTENILKKIQFPQLNSIKKLNSGMVWKLFFAGITCLFVLINFFVQIFPSFSSYKANAEVELLFISLSGEHLISILACALVFWGLYSLNKFLSTML